MRSRLSIPSKCLLALLALMLLPAVIPGTVFGEGRNGPSWFTSPDQQSVGPIRQALRRALEVHKRHSPFLMDMEGVVATGAAIGSDGEPLVKVFTARRGIRGIPRVLEGVSVDVNVSGRIYALADTTARFQRPVPMGVSTGHPDITAGTIGCRVTDGTDVYALSNNHVYANINQAGIGDNVIQPGAYDGGIDPDDAIGTLHAFEPIHFCYYWWFWLICEETNTMDAAIALSSTENLSCSTPADDGYGAPSGEIHPAYGDPTTIGDEDISSLLGLDVKKYGRTTGLTFGTIDAVNASVNVCYDQECSNVARFTDQLIITPGTFSGGGDSGSLIVTDDASNTPVALLFAGSNLNTIANRIDLVLNRFGVNVDSCEETVLTDIAVTSVEAPPSSVESDTVTVEVTVENLGTEGVSSDIAVTLTSDNTTPETADDLTIGTEALSGGLSTGETATLTFQWDTTGANLGDHTLTAVHDAADEVNANDTGSTIVTITGMTIDLAVMDVSAPSTVEQGDSVVDVTVTVQNLGNQDVGSFTVTLDDITDHTGTPLTQDPDGLAAGMQALLTFSWNTSGAGLGNHTLEASVSVTGDSNSTNDVSSTTVSVIEPAAGPMLETGDVLASTWGWTTVTLTHDYGEDMVVVCSPNYDLSITAPTVVHVQNPSGSSFEVRLSPAVFGTFQDWTATVQYMVVKAGVYTLGEHGVQMEAGKFQSPTTAGKRNWVADTIVYQNTYAHPVVLGQVMSYNSGLWSVFWSRGASASSPPSATVCQVGKHVGEDLGARSAETIGYVIIESGSGAIDGRNYLAAVGPDTLRGMGNSPPYTYSLDLDFEPSTAIVSQAGMDGGDGGWPILYGGDFVTAAGLRLAIEEDWYWDSERRHTTEQAAYIVLD